MKRLIIIIILIIQLASYSNSKVFVFADSQYARITKTSEIYSITTTNNQLDDIVCLAEKSYFVEILGEYNNLYRVNYNNISGYIKKSDVALTTSTPLMPYPTNINMKIEYNCNLRSTPTTQSKNNNVICTIPSNETNITFVGRIYGEEAIDFGGNIWYYINYNGHFGYVYNKYFKSVSPIYENTETINYISNEITPINPIQDVPSLIIIIILLIPTLFLIVILYLPMKVKKSKMVTKKKTKIIDRY